MTDVITVMLCGVGGQGTILAADLLARTAAAAGMDVKLSEVHGMAQRGGSVDTVVRFGEEVLSPVTDPGRVDHLVGFEMIEALRRVRFVKQDGRLLVSPRVIEPLPVLTGECEPARGVEEALRSHGAIFVDADEIACSVGSPKSANVVLIGALSAGLPFSAEEWKAVIESRVPARTVAANIAAFDLGRAVCEQRA